MENISDIANETYGRIFSYLEDVDYMVYDMEIAMALNLDLGYVGSLLRYAESHGLTRSEVIYGRTAWQLT